MSDTALVAEAAPAEQEEAARTKAVELLTLKLYYAGSNRPWEDREAYHECATFARNCASDAESLIDELLDNGISLSITQ